MDKRALENTIIEIIKTIFDPEIPVDIYELGLIYEINIDDDVNVKVVMTLTSPNCPAAESLPEEVKVKTEGIEDVKSCEVEIVFDPPWTNDMMSEEAKYELGFM